MSGELQAPPRSDLSPSSTPPSIPRGFCRELSVVSHSLVLISNTCPLTPQLIRSTRLRPSCVFYLAFASPIVESSSWDLVDCIDQPSELSTSKVHASVLSWCCPDRLRLDTPVSLSSCDSPLFKPLPLPARQFQSSCLFAEAMT